jgi:hypothetical protein
MIRDAKETNQDQDSSGEDDDDKLDFMEEEELEMVRNSAAKKTGPVSKRNATDRSADTNVDEIQGKEDEADNTVFIDKLPKDERSIKDMIREVNYHIRDLERQFFEEEDSEAEREMKDNLMKANYSAAEHNEQLERLKEKTYI